MQWILDTGYWIQKLQSSSPRAVRNAILLANTVLGRLGFDFGGLGVDLRRFGVEFSTFLMCFRLLLLGGAPFLARSSAKLPRTAESSPRRKLRTRSPAKTATESIRPQSCQAFRKGGQRYQSAAQPGTACEIILSRSSSNFPSPSKAKFLTATLLGV